MDRDITETNGLPENRVIPKTFDPEKYRHHFADGELSAAQQNELLEALWHIMGIFVDIGWGVDTVQMFLPELSEKSLPDSGKLIDSKDANTSKQAVRSGKGRQNE